MEVSLTISSGHPLASRTTSGSFPSSKVTFHVPRVSFHHLRPLPDPFSTHPTWFPLQVVGSLRGVTLPPGLGPGKMSYNYLSRNDELRRGDYLMSNNGQWKAVFQDDGNFVIYGWKPVWASDTNGSDAVRLIMQEDCNLVLYNNDNHPKWASDTFTPGSHACRLQLSDDGILRLYKGANELWNSTKSREVKK
ncbi:hypothetical protein CRENBAI_024120 [Crenichthys baileyi]|uniref:Bulb-type lectin domain-containing protein n=1 Tax=Crenichthys baileyi TaxID=28760 RepID=A0AAV9QZ20_9TELE